MEEKPRYSRTSDILELLIFMQSRVQGVSLSQIQEKFKVSRRTAERMRDSLLNIFPQITEIENTYSREKYWGFMGGYMNEIINFTPEELAQLEKLKTYQEENGFEDKEKILEQVITKIKSLSRKYINKLENSMQIVLESEGYAIRQMPKYKIDLNFLEIIRESLKSSKKILAKYNDKDKILSPYGLIYGEKMGQIHIVICYINFLILNYYLKLLKKIILILMNIQKNLLVFIRANVMMLNFYFLRMLQMKYSIIIFIIHKR